MQSGMREQTSQEIEIQQMEGPVLEALVSFMYGKLRGIPPSLLVPLLVAADAHQVCILTVKL